MSVKTILTYPELSLLRPSEIVVEVDQTIRTLIDDMADTLYNTTGVGLSAPQIGVNKRVIMYDPYRDDDSESKNFRVLINPIIVSTTGRILSKGEGCKSFPGLRMDIERAETIQLKGLDQDGKDVSIEATGFEAIVLQHEIDHINGVVMIDHVSTEERNLYKWYAQNLVNISKRLTWLQNKPDGILLQQSGNDENMLIVKDGNQIILYFAGKSDSSNERELSGIMSRIDIYNPIKLLGIYTQAMMLTLVLNNHPKRVYMLGFGGGRIPMIFHHYFPEIIVEGSEINPKIASLTNKYFGIKSDNRLKVAIQEGRKHLSSLTKNRYDIILVDCYTGVGHHPYTLSTVEFYNLCKSRLTEFGVVATNLIDSGKCQASCRLNLKKR